MELAFCFLAIPPGVVFSLPLSVSESASGCNNALETLQAGFQAQPENSLELFLDAIQTNPDCRRELLIEVVRFMKKDPS